MPVDPELKVVVDMVNSQPQPAAAEQGATALRAAFAALAPLLGQGDPSVQVSDVELALEGRTLGARRYLPAAGDAVDGAGTIVFFHGGGWVIGSVDTHDACCRNLASAAGWPVVSVEYRCAPEHPFPAAHDDAEDSVRWLAGHAAALGLDTGRLVLAGDSAGANLAAAAARRLRDHPVQGTGVSLVALVYPVTDALAPEEHESFTSNGEGYLLTADTMRFFLDSYLPDPLTRRGPDASPLRADDLGALPPTVVITAEYDPLRDEGEAFAAALAAAGNQVELVRLDGAVHMALQLVDTGIGRSMLAAVASRVRALG